MGFFLKKELYNKTCKYSSSYSYIVHLIHSSRQRKPFAFAIANALVFKKIKKAMGFDRCLSFYSGAAPISIDVLHYFMSLDIPILEIYGMSESSGMFCANGHCFYHFSCTLFSITLLEISRYNLKL